MNIEEIKSELLKITSYGLKNDLIELFNFIDWMNDMGLINIILEANKLIPIKNE